MTRRASPTLRALRETGQEMDIAQKRYLAAASRWVNALKRHAASLRAKKRKAK